ncbi:hypothetical protein SKAU_G00227340 [Synaphobranchus kaupii]|uniref:TNFR-Cys domain-containing protein n=1 Tax=Synaphobranchus kaupii TaxID=118154 RepID=A0A9Q1F4Y9_SYNKA|nr:hypothetical protein SKAU_G00227340 [Synaphobranchus kaupii]
MEPGAPAVILTVFCCALAVADPGCDQAQFLHANGSCVTCPTCGPGEQLSEDCGYGDGGEGRCMACGEGEFSAEEGLAPCWQCTQCSLLNRDEHAPCTPASNAECGRCLRGYYEIKRKSGVIEALCMPCYSPTGRIRKECQPPSSLQAHISTAGAEPVPVSMALIGSVSAAVAFLLVHLLWVLLLTVERLKQGPKGLAGQEDLSGPQPAESLHMLLPCSLPCATPCAMPSTMPSHEGQPDQWAHGTEDTPRCLNSLKPEKDMHSTSIVINLTTNIKPSCLGGDSEWEGHEGVSHTPEAKMSLEEVFCCALAVADPGCDQAQFLHANGSCVTCPTCGPGEQLSEDCGYGDGGEGRCMACGEGEFSAEEGLAPCWQCTQCSLLNRDEHAPCTPASNAECGRCLRGYYEIKRKSGVIEALCMPCYSPTGRIRKECQPPSSLQAHISTAGAEPVPVSMALIGSVSAAVAFLLVHLLWVLLLTVERLKQGPKGLAGQEDLSGPQPAESLHMLLPCSLPCATPCAMPSTMPSHEGQPDQWAHGTEDTPRCLNSLKPEKDMHSPSIVINLTTNIKPSCLGGDSEWEGHEGVSHMPEAKMSLEEYPVLRRLGGLVVYAGTGQSLEKLDYDTVQDLSLLLDAGGRGGGVRRLGQALAVPPEVLNNLRGFQDLFQYLRTSTYTLLPQLAQAAASLPRPDIISRIHRGLAASSSYANANART